MKSVNENVFFMRGQQVILTHSPFCWEVLHLYKGGGKQNKYESARKPARAQETNKQNKKRN
jgi:hypothetical protein